MRYIKPQWRPSASQRRTRMRNVIDVSAFASVMLALLALLMGPSLQVVHPRQIPVDLASTENSSARPGALRDDAIIATITRDGSLYLASAKISLHYLLSALHELNGTCADKTIYIKANARAKYADVKAVLDKIHLAGIQSVTFLTN